MIDKQEVISQAQQFLSTQNTGVLGTVSSAGLPHTSTVYFTYTDDFSVYFIVSHHSEKFKNLVCNPHASFTVGAGPEYREVVIRGAVQLLDDPHARESIISKITERVTSPMREWPLFSIASLVSGGTALFELTPTQVQYLDLESQNEASDFAKYIYQLVP